MARKPLQRDVIVKLIVGAGQASPSPPVGPALGSKGVKSMDFCKEFNARTAHLTAGTPTPALVTIRPDRTFSFILRTPPTSTLLLAAAGAKERKGRVRGATRPGHAEEGEVGVVGRVSLKHVWEIAKVKAAEDRLAGLGMQALVKCVVGQARGMGVEVVA